MNNNHKAFEDKLKQLPSYRLTQSKKDQIHQGVMEALKDDDMLRRVRGKNGIRRFIVGITTAVAILLVSIISVNLISTNNNLTGDVKEPEVIQEPSQIGQPEAPNQDPEDKQVIIEEKAKEIIQVLHNRNMDVLASYVHKEKGLLFAPVAYIEDYSLTFPQDKIATLLEDPTEYVWGYQEANSEIKLSPSAYFEERIHAELFLNPDEIKVDPNVPSGERSTNIKDYFPESTVVEFHYAGTEKYSGMDWKSLHLVFEENEQEGWDLVAIVNGLWAP